MKNWTKFASLWSILFAVEVHCSNVTEREPIHDLHDALVLIPGCEIIISCCGDVYVNRLLMVRGTCTGVHGSDSEQITTKKIGLLALSNHRPDPVDSLETNQLQREAFTLHEGTARTDDEAGSDLSEMDNCCQWTLNDQPVQDVTKMGRDLMLPRFGMADAGNYSCYRAGRRMSTVRIHPANSTERPILTCRRKAPNRKIRCDWKAGQAVSPAPKCHLMLKIRCSGEWRSVSCRYSARRSRCRCLIEPQVSEKPQCTDISLYEAVLVVKSTLGSGTSELVKFRPANVLKPDPPSRVDVTSVEGMERMLQVSWSYPTSWKKGFYNLKFELRYHPEHGKMYQTKLVEKPPWCILDALPNVQYIVQIRAKEEHDEGSWSDWSPPVYAHTWTALLPTEASYTTDISEKPLILMVIPDPSTKPEMFVKMLKLTVKDSVGRPGIVDGLLWVHVVSVIGCCVMATMFILVFIQVIRHRIHFKSKVEKWCFPFPSPGPPLHVEPSQPKAQDCPLNNSASQEPLSPEQTTKQQVNFHNMSYFLTKADTR